MEIRWHAVLGVVALVAAPACADRALGQRNGSVGSDDETDADGASVSAGDNGGQAGGDMGTGACELGDDPDVWVSVSREGSWMEPFLLVGLRCGVTYVSEPTAFQWKIELDCTDAAGGAESIEILKKAVGVAAPESLTAGAQVEARVQSWRDAEQDEYGSDHFILLRDGVPLIAGGDGTRWPSSDDVSSADFYAPLRITRKDTGCLAPSFEECDELTWGELEVAIGDAQGTVGSFSTGTIDRYDAHVGGTYGSEGPACGAPHLDRLSFVIARQSD